MRQATYYPPHRLTHGHKAAVAVPMKSKSTPISRTNVPDIAWQNGTQQVGPDVFRLLNERKEENGEAMASAMRPAPAQAKYQLLKFEPVLQRSWEVYIIP
jgi:hypothetical protein